MSILIREATIDDAPALTGLTHELGYAADDEIMELRLFRILFEPGGGVFVAEDKDSIVGWIHVCRSLTLESDPKAEIRGLVVTEAYRGRGIGRSLVGAAERWAGRYDLRAIRVRSRLQRETALAFYDSLGYSTLKDQRVFEKKLKPIAELV